jgi:hypothetical protein
MTTEKTTNLRPILESQFLRLQTMVNVLEDAITLAAVEGHFGAEEPLENLVRDLLPLPQRLKSIIEMVPEGS